MKTEKKNIKLETKLVGEIEGKFYIPSFQRGYRWGKIEVSRLLDDIYLNASDNYCLQPIVVKRKSDVYELIDGQQRLTTLYLIYKYMNIFSNGFIDEPKFSLVYDTRSKSEKFLKTIDYSRKEENIDFWFISNAYEIIEEWFNEKNKKSIITNINKYFDENIKIIWYEVDDSEDSIALFTRLNIGKILLTSAELVKAMFLSESKNKGMIDEKKDEIALQWDNIEKELHNNSLWYFLTNSYNKNYQTRIDLILDLIAGKPLDNKDKYYTFFYFDNLSKIEELSEIWKEIQHTFLILKDWFENHELYHKIGYLIATNTKTLQEIFSMSREEIDGKRITKSKFKSNLDSYISESIEIKQNYSELSYDKDRERAQISRLLLLFNIESVRQNGEKTKWFPFDKHKFQTGGKTTWSLEHIHAQESQGMRRQEDWKEWLRLHIESIENLNNNDNIKLIEKIKDAIRMETLFSQDFKDLQGEVIEKLSTEGNTEFMHSISNLALLNTSDNAALNNSTFDVKRNNIINLDKKGQYIPFSTRMVFFKYYTPSSVNQLQFWGQEDRLSYIEAINRTLKSYLKEKILIGKEEN